MASVVRPASPKLRPIVAEELSDPNLVVDGSQTDELTPVQKAWAAYVAHLQKWFYDPDIQAAAITIATAVSQYSTSSQPVWLFVLGPPGGDKTSICANTVSEFPNAHVMGDITEKTFLSGYTGTANASLLQQLGSSATLVFKDFTTFASKQKNEQAAISSQLREIFDGYFNKNTGKGPIQWKGKLTVIGCGTTALERAWAGKRQMGERFIHIKIKRKDGVAQSRVAQRQRGFEGFISKTMRELAKGFLQAEPFIATTLPELTESQSTRVAYMGEMICHCRASVERDPTTRKIEWRDEAENTSRVTQEIATLVASYAAMFRRNYIGTEDMDIAVRATKESIPTDRFEVISLLAKEGGGRIPIEQVIARLNVPETAVRQAIGDLQCLGVLEVHKSITLPDEVSFAPKMKVWWEQAFEPLKLAPVILPGQVLRTQ